MSRWLIFVSSDEKGETPVSAMPKTGKFWTWPDPPDIVWYKARQVVRQMDPPREIKPGVFVADLKRSSKSVCKTQPKSCKFEITKITFPSYVTMKKFFEEKKRSLKFKLAGPGHKLSDSSNSNLPSSSKSEDEVKKRVDNEEDQAKRSAALAAALQRSQGNKKKDEGQLRLKKLEMKDAVVNSKERGNEECTDPVAEDGNEPSAPGVFFKCAPLDETAILSRQEWNEKIKSHIFELKEADIVLGSILQIKSLNSGKEADECISLMVRYLRNIIDNPDIEKYKSIRMGNPKFSEKVLNTDGALDFLLAVGFEKQEIDDGTTESYLNFKGESSELESLIQSLLEINGFQLELFRDFQIFEPQDIPSEATALPDDFFEITVTDVKRQQQQRALQLERESMLMTRKMREMEKLKFAPRKPLYTRIRVRLPNDYVIQIQLLEKNWRELENLYYSEMLRNAQGTFSVLEPFSKLRTFIEEHVLFDSEYSLMAPPSYIYDQKYDEKTFQELNLQPAVQLFLKTSAESIEIVY